MTEPNQQTLERQIAELQQKLDAARTEAGKDIMAPYERQEIHAAVGEKIRQQMPTYQLPGSIGVGNVPTVVVPSYQNPTLAPEVQKLVNIAFTQDLQQAIDQAVKTGNPALIDALHDVLADQLHAELIKRQKLQPAV